MSDLGINEIIGNLHYVADLLTVAKQVARMPNCNDCVKADCEYKPPWGMPVRYNCPLHARKEDRHGY